MLSSTRFQVDSGPEPELEVRLWSGPPFSGRFPEFIYPNRSVSVLSFQTFNISFMAVNCHNIVNQSCRPLTAGIYAPIPSFFLPKSEDLGTLFTSKSCRLLTFCSRHPIFRGTCPSRNQCWCFTTYCWLHGRSYSSVPL